MLPEWYIQKCSVVVLVGQKGKSVEYQSFDCLVWFESTHGSSANQVQAFLLFFCQCSLMKIYPAGHEQIC